MSIETMKVLLTVSFTSWIWKGEWDGLSSTYYFRSVWNHFNGF